VGVTDRAHPVGARHGGAGERGREHGAYRGRGTGDVLQVQCIKGALEGAQNVPASGVCDGELVHELGEYLDVLHELPHLDVEHRQGDPAHVVERLAVGRVHVTELRAHTLDERVGRRLDVELDGFPALGPVGDPQPGVHRVEALDGSAVGAVDERLRGEAGAVGGEPEVDHGLHRAAGPRGRHRPGEVEPARAPGWAPRLARLRRAVWRLQRFGDGDRLARGVPDLDLERDVLTVHRGPQSLAQDALDAPLDQDAVVVHAGLLGEATDASAGKRFPRSAADPRLNPLMRQYWRGTVAASGRTDEQ
jgi:hypothetical protein